MQLGQAVKNVQRLRTILGVFARHGFIDVVDRMNLGKFLPSRLQAFAVSQAEKSPAERVRQSFEELGPSFVKLGQLLSTRPDIIPDQFLEEFTKLQDKVLPLDFEIIRRVVEMEFGGKKIEEVYAFFDPTPLASASIAQVHEARLHTGEKVVVKVQRPEIEKIVATDVSLLDFLAGLLEKYVPESRSFRPKVIVDEFFRTLSYELDFVVEANNTTRIAKNLASIPDVVIPKVYKELSTQRVLTLEKLEGIRVNDQKALDAAGVDRKHVITIGARAFFKSVMIDGLFHGDLHAGNLFVLPGNRLGMIDFGIVGRLSEKSRDQLANMMISLITEDYENLCYTYAEVSVSGQSVDLEAFQREVRNVIAPYVGLSIQDVNSGRMLIEATKIGAKYNIQVPGDWMLVFKAIFTMDGMGRVLDPSFDLLSTGQDLVKELIRNQYSPQKIRKELIWAAKDISALLQIVPRQLRGMLKKFASNDYAVEIKSPDLEGIRYQMDINGRRMSLSILMASLFLASSIALNHSTEQTLGNYPVMSLVFLVMAVVVLIRLFFMRGK